jgi:hypothetical protein
MKFRLLITFLFLITAAAKAQENIHDAGTVSKELMPYASAVVRNEQISISVKDLENTIYHVKSVITVFNKNGDDDAAVLLWNDKLTSIRDAKGIIYNSAGIPIAKFGLKDFKDEYADDGFSLFNDTRVEYYLPVVTDYPYTIECEYELRFKQTLILPDWTPNEHTGVAVEKSAYSITCKPDFNIRYKEINMPSGVIINTDKEGLKSYAWQINDLKAVKEEPYSPAPQNYLSTVKVAAEKFEYDGVSGNFTNWNDLGKWVYDKLLADREVVSPETAAMMKELTAGIDDPKLKAKKIYEYMQGRTRYVSIQVGIGGYQPFPATDVDNLKYGDCKALVNYTQALLKVVGIDSWYCQVMADPEKKINYLTDFASMDQGNHIILCLPFKNDTTWCDCTNETIPFGYIGDFTDDRMVLACTPEGGKLMRTRKYTADDNIELRKANVTIDTAGNLAGDMATRFGGIDYEDRNEIIAGSPAERIKDLQHIYPINNLHVVKLDFVQDKSLQPITTEYLGFKASEYASVDAGKMYFLPSLANRLTHIPPQVLNRVTDMYINEGYTEEDDITYTLPPGYHLESETNTVKLQKPFGSFSTTSEVKDGKLIYHRKFKLIDGTYPKDTYADLVDFFQDVYDADGQNLTLVKN